MRFSDYTPQHLDPSDYQGLSDGERAAIDSLMETAGIENTKVTHIEINSRYAVFDVMDTNSRGMFSIDPQTNEVATRKFFYKWDG